MEEFESLLFLYRSFIVCVYVLNFDQILGVHLL